MILQSDTYHFYCTRMLERGNPGEKTPRRSRALLGRGSGHILSELKKLLISCLSVFCILLSLLYYCHIIINTIIIIIIIIELLLLSLL